MKRKWLAVVIILLFVGTCVFPATSQEIEKSQSTSRGNWLYVGGSGPGNYTRIQDAINDSSDGDTVFVYDDSSPYYENVKVNKSITLFGENRDTVIIDANGSGCPIVSISSNVTIIGFTIQNSERGISHAGIFIYTRCDNNVIIGNKIINNNFGIYLLFSSNNLIYNNVIIQNKRSGIYCDDCETSTIENNNIINNSYCGIWVDSSDQTTISRNHIDDNYPQGLLIVLSSFCIISNNSFSNHSEKGILLANAYGSRISSNNFFNNKEDVWFEVAMFYAFNRNRFMNNYWDSYRGSGPKAILGLWLLFFIPWLHGYSFPVYIPWFYFDWHPAQKPYDIPGVI